MTLANVLPPRRVPVDVSVGAAALRHEWRDAVRSAAAEGRVLVEPVPEFFEVVAEIVLRAASEVRDD